MLSLTLKKLAPVISSYAWLNASIACSLPSEKILQKYIYDVLCNFTCARMRKKNTRVSDKKVLMTFIENIGTY